MNQSSEINHLALALSTLQAELRGAKKDGTNFFGGKYADLEAIWEAARPLLAKNGLSVCQTMGYISYEAAPPTTTLVTTLMHSSGQWKAGEMPLILAKLDPQAQGSAISYARRYAMSAILGIVQTDDDAQSAMPEGTHSIPVVTMPVIIPPDPSEGDWEDLKIIGVDQGWPESYMQMCIDKEKRMGKSLSVVWKLAFDRFSHPNVNTSVDENKSSTTHKSTACNKCGADIVWLVTRNGKKCPVPAESVAPDDDLFDKSKHTSHWDMCLKQA